MKFLKLILGFGILCGVQSLCNLVLTALNFSFPAPIMGIIILAILLKLNIIRREWVKDICELFLKYMPLFFVPLFVGIVAYYGLIEENLVPILVNVAVTTSLVIIISALFVENVIKFVRLYKIRRSKND